MSAKASVPRRSRMCSGDPRAVVVEVNQERYSRGEVVDRREPKLGKVFYEWHLVVSLQVVSVQSLPANPTSGPLIGALFLQEV